MAVWWDIYNEIFIESQLPNSKIMFSMVSRPINLLKVSICLIVASFDELGTNLIM